MGYETKCRARVTGADNTVREADATVLLETDELIVRGEARIRIPRAAIQRMSVRAGVLTITSPVAVVALSLGDEAAAKWRKKIEEPPKRLIDKLDVTANAKVWLLGIEDRDLAAQVAERTSRLLSGRSASECDVVFVGVESPAQLDRIERALAATKADGAIWVVHRKGPTGVADTTIFDRAKRLGLTYTKVARVSDTHTAEKLVRPVATRLPFRK
ncbi:MAG: hypothetical protein ABJF01_26235 [bacterium]